MSPEFTECRQFLELRIRQGIGAGVEIRPSGLHVVHSHGAILSLQVDQQPETTGAGADNPFNFIADLGFIA
jgi:hypothetical protein